MLLHRRLRANRAKRSQFALVVLKGKVFAPQELRAIRLRTGLVKRSQLPPGRAESNSGIGPSFAGADEGQEDRLTVACETKPIRLAVVGRSGYDDGEIVNREGLWTDGE